MIDDKFRIVVALVVTGVWAVLALSTIATGAYTALGAATPVMMIVVGFLFGYKSEARKNGAVHADVDAHSSDLSDWGGG